MVNPNLIKLAKRTGNEELPKLEVPKGKPEKRISAVFPEVNSSFILTYDDYGKELITKNNEIFKGTKAEIPLGKDREEVPNMHILKRLALITTIYNNPQLRSQGLWPITPLQSEQLLKEGKLPNPEKYWEDLALILYDTNGVNPKEAQALYNSLKQNIQNLGLSNSDLESRLLIVNSGLEVDLSMPHKVKPIIFPELTKVYVSEVLQKTGEDYKFEYGLENGLPKLSDLGKGRRNLYMPSVNNIGLKVLYRNRYLYLYAGFGGLASSCSGGRVVVCAEGARKK